MTTSTTIAPRELRPSSFAALGASSLEPKPRVAAVSRIVPAAPEET